jgi:hypothetical protein
MLTKLKHFWVFSLSFLILFDCIALPLFTDSGKTTVMYLITSVILQLMNFILFALVLFFPGKLKILYESLLLYIISEICMLLFTGKLLFFGIFLKNDYSFGKEQAVYFSACCLISAGIYYFYSLKKQKYEDSGRN